MKEKPIYKNSNKNKGPSIKEVINESDSNKRDQIYNEYVKSVTPKHSLVVNILNAFWIGGLICTIGQGLINFYQYLGANLDLAMLYNTLSLVFLSILLTGLNVYGKIAKYGGAGTIVPITGFANSVAAPAIEFKKEGQVFGIGCMIFTICGPVILYGIFSSWVFGLIYYIVLRLQS